MNSAASSQARLWYRAPGRLHSPCERPARRRSFFVAGVRAAIVQVHNEQTLIMEPRARMNTEEVCDSLSRIYSDPVNLAIPVTAAMMVVKLRVTGTSPAKVEAALAALRKTAAEDQ